jgi:hypothetical protein
MTEDSKRNRNRWLWIYGFMIVLAAAAGTSALIEHHYVWMSILIVGGIFWALCFRAWWRAPLDEPPKRI